MLYRVMATAITISYGVQAGDSLSHERPVPGEP
jgi:hypothetical protein